MCNGCNRTKEQHKPRLEKFRTLLTMLRSPNTRQSGSLVGEHSPSSEWGRSLWRGNPDRQQADRERADAKSKDRRQVRLPGQRQGDVVRGRRQVRYQEIHPEQSAGG